MILVGCDFHSRYQQIACVGKEIRRGLRFEKSFAGETTFAAIFVFNVAISKAISAMKAQRLLL